MSCHELSQKPTRPSTFGCYVVKTNHVSQFVSDDGSDPLLVGVGGEFVVVQQSGLSVSYQTPVLHRSSIEVRQRYLICIRNKTIYMLN